MSNNLLIDAAHYAPYLTPIVIRLVATTFGVKAHALVHAVLHRLGHVDHKGHQEPHRATGWSKWMSNRWTQSIALVLAMAVCEQGIDAFMDRFKPEEKEKTLVRSVE